MSSQSKTRSTTTKRVRFANPPCEHLAPTKRYTVTLAEDRIPLTGIKLLDAAAIESCLFREDPYVYEGYEPPPAELMLNDLDLEDDNDSSVRRELKPVSWENLGGSSLGRYALDTVTAGTGESVPRSVDELSTEERLGLEEDSCSSRSSVSSLGEEGKEESDSEDNEACGEECKAARLA